MHVNSGYCTRLACNASPARTFGVSAKQSSRQSPRKRDAFANTRDACATGVSHRATPIGWENGAAASDADALQSSRIEFAEMLCGFDIAPSPARNVFLFFERERALHFCRRTENERTRRNLCPESDQGICSDDRASTDLRPIENDCPHAEEHFVVDGAGVNDGAVTDGDELPKPRLVRRVDVNDGVVLNVGPRADNNAIDITAQNGAVLYTRFFHQRYVADDGCARGDVGGFVNTRAKF